MRSIQVESNPSEERLEELGIFDWPIWTKEPSKFPWTYETSETSYLLAGEVVVTSEGGDPVEFGKGDLVTFPEGMNCTWDVRKAVRKHYRMG